MRILPVSATCYNSTAICAERVIWLRSRNDLNIAVLPLGLAVEANR